MKGKMVFYSFLSLLIVSDFAFAKGSQLTVPFSRQVIPEHSFTANYNIDEQAGQRVVCHVEDVGQPAGVCYHGDGRDHCEEIGGTGQYTVFLTAKGPTRYGDNSFQGHADAKGKFEIGGNRRVKNFYASCVYSLDPDRKNGGS